MDSATKKNGTRKNIRVRCPRPRTRNMVGIHLHANISYKINDIQGTTCRTQKVGTE